MSWSGLLSNGVTSEYATAKRQAAITGGVPSFGIFLPSILLAMVVLPFAGWGFTDDDIFVLHYLKGESPPLYILPGQGRFSPLAHQEWRLIQWARDVHWYHIFAILQYALFCWAIWHSLRLLQIRGVLPFILIISLPPVVISFANLVIVERTQLMVFAFWLLAYLKWTQDDDNIAGMAAIFCCNFALYNKETAFLFFFGFAITQIIGACLSNGILGSLSRRWCDIAIVLSSIFFVTAYLYFVPIAMLFDINTYNGHSLSIRKLLPTAAEWVSREPLFFIFLVVGFTLSIRRLIIIQSRPSVTDALAVGALCYATGLLAAGLISKYYLALPLTSLVIHFSDLLNRNVARPQVSTIAFTSIILLNILLLVPSLLYRYDWINRNGKIADVVEAVNVNPGRVKIIVIGDPWDITMFALYVDQIHEIDIEILGDKFAPNCWWKSTLCRERLENESVRMTVDLGQTTLGQRNGVITLDRQRIWEYHSWEQVFLARLPWPVSTILKSHYNVF